MDWSRIGLVTGAGAIGYTALRPMPTSSADMDELSTVEKLGLGTAAVLGTGAAAYGLGKGTEKAGEYLLKNGVNIERAVSTGLGKAVGKGITHVAIPAVKGATEAIAGPAMGVIDIVSKASFFRDPKKFPDNLGHFGMSNIGKGIAVAGALVAGIKGGIDSYNKAKMGQSYGLETSTPQNILYDVRQDLADTYGAGGDLVFALNQNRRG